MWRFWISRLLWKRGRQRNRVCIAPDRTFHQVLVVSHTLRDWRCEEQGESIPIFATFDSSSCFCDLAGRVF